MEKSFYYVVQERDALRYMMELNTLGIPHDVEVGSMIPRLNVSEVAIVFPELLVRKYDFIKRMFGRDAKKYGKSEK